MTLAADECAGGRSLPVILLHGGGQTRHSWAGTLDALAAAGFYVVSLDLRGHGDSGWATDGAYGLDAHLSDLRAVIDELGGRAVVVGASLGGLTGLLAAGEDDDERVAALVMVDVVPAIELEGAKEIRAFMTARPDGFGSVEEAAEVVAAYLPHRPRPSSADGLMKNLRQRPDGRLHWHWDPAMFGAPTSGVVTAFRERAEAAARRVEVPTLLVRGGMSRVVSGAGVRAFLDLVTHAEYVNVADAGHMVAGDRNDAFTRPLLAFLTRVIARIGNESSSAPNKD
ncbi:alpha/beta fold hydrolase [Sphingomonas bacterium]|uniref:alpha/beta fold hydrolase n=1 Tax=Sphingomonas bacterium TaxID=1895847 RepID=UPI0015768F54|nr:alpha/beta hydrolase [Sphingomonas bacterium]